MAGAEDSHPDTGSPRSASQGPVRSLGNDDERVPPNKSESPLSTTRTWGSAHHGAESPTNLEPVRNRSPTHAPRSSRKEDVPVSPSRGSRPATPSPAQTQTTTLMSFRSNRNILIFAGLCVVALLSAMQALAPPLATLFSDTGLVQDDAPLLPEQESSSSQSGSDRIVTAPKDSGMPPPAKSSGKARRGRLQCEANAKSGISVRRDPCFVSGISKRCGCPSRFTLRLLRPRSSVNLDLTPSQLQDETVFAYIHVNKAGGQTVKSILMDAIQRGNWSAADLGTYTGWQALRNPALATSVEDIDVFKHPSIEIFSCGDEGTRHALPRPTRIGKCAVRAIWGGLSMGLCDLFPERPCMYFTTLRDPIKRAVSEYNYFCVLGAEHRKKWLPEWRKLGHCPVDIYEYFKMELTVPNFLKLRLTRGCDTKCGVEAAKTNLAHPCVQFLVIEHMKEDMRRFADKLQGPLADAFEAALHEETHINKSELQARTKAQMQNETLMGNLAGLLEDDMVIYNYALTIRDEKWRSPLQACPASM